MKLKKSYNTEILVTGVALLCVVAAFTQVIPLDKLKESEGVLIVIGIMLAFIMGVAFALLLGYLLGKSAQGEVLTFKEFNPGVTFSIKALNKKEPEKKSSFLDDTAFQYIVSCEEEIFLLTDFRSIPEGDYFKDGKTGRIKRVDTDSKDFKN